MDDNNLQDETVIEGEVTEDGVSDVSANDAASTLLSLEQLIKNHVESIDKLKLELKQSRQMYDDSFANDPTYRELTEQAKEASKKRNQLKQQISKQPSVAQLAQKIKDLAFDLREQTKTLSDLLQDYKEQTGATQIELANGKVMEIVSILKLVAKNSKYNP